MEILAIAQMLGGALIAHGLTTSISYLIWS